MRILFISSLLFSTFATIYAQTSFSLKEEEAFFVYSLPKTEFCIEIQTEKISQKQGIFYRYSERYLATNKVITEEKVTYRLKSIEVHTRSIPDTNRTFKFVPSKKSESRHISVNSKGLLCGVNVPLQAENISKEDKIEVINDKPIQSGLLPLGEEYMMAGSESKLAEGAAKQIYRIRESRLSLLTADVEKLPADGSSLKLMLEGLNKMEKELTELFIGTITNEPITNKIYLVPDSALNKKVLFRLSALMGVVSKDDLSGTPYYINIKPKLNSLLAADKKSKAEPIEIYTILPADTEISISDGVKTLYSEHFFVPQFGKTVALSGNVLLQPKVIIRIDPQTGRLMGIE